MLDLSFPEVEYQESRVNTPKWRLRMPLIVLIGISEDKLS